VLTWIFICQNVFVDPFISNFMPRRISGCANNSRSGKKEQWNQWMNRRRRRTEQAQPIGSERRCQTNQTFA
jgi:hypothetical protein